MLIRTFNFFLIDLASPAKFKLNILNYNRKLMMGNLIVKFIELLDNANAILSNTLTLLKNNDYEEQSDGYKKMGSKIITILKEKLDQAWRISELKILKREFKLDYNVTENEIESYFIEISMSIMLENNRNLDQYTIIETEYYIKVIRSMIYYF
jgi:hypothetical protein